MPSLLVVPAANDQVNPRRDQVHVDGNRVFMRPSSEVKWVALNKPKGVICTVSDELGRPTAVSAIPRGQEMRLVPVGRLDRDSCGLLLLTNENSWVSCLLRLSSLFSRVVFCSKHLPRPRYVALQHEL